MSRVYHLLTLNWIFVCPYKEGVWREFFHLDFDRGVSEDLTVRA
ncbi:hypothetical protein BLA9940_06706 [Burkholderia aenigmatica]|uniref:Uncharacterized protein n=1 Tax=Burkholderia aenigmatica TaxID=2015348 RepID=A0A6J5JBE3_9BURK|nr:hypothetical protein BLA3211_05185 [Burkholderia aenigmatica]VWC99887.1 hypothetical protein BLA17378_05156 [Burkholderia aenigmatica]VWD09160.1 hypothetical protein BLA9940_06706 [Burkholderia aenigmatica]VWD41221.1 hypothetical protein BLA18628_05341 [Burkholderia aenigmatica]